MTKFLSLAVALTIVASAAWADPAGPTAYEPLIAVHAKANGVPVSLVHRVIMRESRYRRGVVGQGGAMGLMQIKTPTARGVGYSGSAAGLLDPETNLTYGIRYLAGAYRLAAGNEDLAISYYARGYYYVAKNKGLRVEALVQPRAEGEITPVADARATSVARSSTDIYATREE